VGFPSVFAPISGEMVTVFVTEITLVRPTSPGQSSREVRVFRQPAKQAVAGHDPRKQMRPYPPGCRSLGREAFTPLQVLFGRLTTRPASFSTSPCGL
jgi:hypothetical protein